MLPTPVGTGQADVRSGLPRADFESLPALQSTRARVVAPSPPRDRRAGGAEGSAEPPGCRVMAGDLGAGGSRKGQNATAGGAFTAAQASYGT